MDKDKKLQEIFDNDPLGLLYVKPYAGSGVNEDEKLIQSFQEINVFYAHNNREPQLGGGIQEHQLYSRLKAMRQNGPKKDSLKYFDKYGLLSKEIKRVESLDDILNDDVLGLLKDDSEGLFELRNVKSTDERASADFIARRKPCKNFDKYENAFSLVQKDLSVGKRKLLHFSEENLKSGTYYVHNGVLLLLENVEFEEQVQEFKSGRRARTDGRTRVIFENGTESNMLYRSLYKSLLENGKTVSENSDEINREFIERFIGITDEDKEAGFIYILKSKSEKEEIKEISNLYKIGYSKIPVEERIKNAVQEPTYLMADVRIVMAYKCYNLNPQKLELLLHSFFGSACLDIDIFDTNGIRHTPREWFIAPLYIIEAAIDKIVSGEIIHHKYDSMTEQIIARNKIG